MIVNVTKRGARNIISRRMWALWKFSAHSADGARIEVSVSPWVHDWIDDRGSGPAGLDHVIMYGFGETYRIIPSEEV